MTIPEVGSGTLIDGRYRILSRVGSGGMADVFCAEDQQLGRRVALKLLHRRFSEDPGFVERFRREAQAAAGLQHPNVVSVYDRGDYEGIYYIAMEYLPGRSLKQVIREEAPIEPVRAIDMTLQILKAARFAHRHGVIHRDLKPHNVIVDDAGHVKVTDFGIARAGASDMTETGSIMGTAQYLSPEQAQGHAVSASSDVYSVAVVLYELLTGRVPFDAESAVTIALKHVSEAPTAPTSVNPQIPPELEQIVLWGLNKNPADRPKDADQFIAALEAARASILSGQTGQRTASMAAVGAGAVPVDAAALAPMAAAAAVPAFLSDPASGATEPPLGPPPERRRQSPWPWLALLLALLLLGGGAAAYFLLLNPAKAVLPPVVGQPLNTARTILQNRGFSSINVITVADPKPAQTVIGENPVAGNKIKTSTPVTLTVSSGPGSVTVPQLMGNTVGQAKALLAQAGLKAGPIEHQSNSTTPNGEVIESSPGVDQSVPAGSKVTLIVSSGPAKVNVPDVTGESQAQAKSDLHAAGFEVTATNQTSSSVQAGNVITQSPAGNTQAVPGTTVTITVAKAPTTASVPNVKGQPASAAQAALQAAGFKVVQQPKKVNHPDRNGVVVSQSPAGSTTAKKGSTVTIAVGVYTAPSGSTGATGSTGSTVPGLTTP
ncbi:MAG TPA: Stk1 family PASTA domain-containing Ser/Thr kinase [Solirubrobacteraceae bacterium]|nr:Stk1 family PASTA domain-containing Ser/Thr kinase [Solirubrobacteraceae bacterium]